MSFDFESLDVAIPEVSHVGIVVRDLEAAMDNYGRILGVDPWRTYRFEPPAWSETTYLGEPAEYSMRVALASAGEDTVELIEPLEGRSCYTDHLDEHGEGLHHVACFAFDDPAAVVERFEASGIPVLQYGSYEGVDIWYLDTRETLNGVVFETAGNLGAMPDADGTYSVDG